MKKINLKIEEIKKYLRENKLNIILLAFPILVTIFIFLVYLWPSYQEYVNAKKLLQEKNRLIKRYRQKIKDIGNIEPSKDGYRKYIFSGKDPYIIVSMLQERLENVEGLTIRSFRITSQQKFLGNIKKVSLFFNMQGDIKSLVEMLDIIQKIQKSILIRKLNVSFFSSGGKEYLQINLTLEAIFAPQSPA